MDFNAVVPGFLCDLIKCVEFVTHCYGNALPVVDFFYCLNCYSCASIVNRNLTCTVDAAVWIFELGKFDTKCHKSA